MIILHLISSSGLFGAENIVLSLAQHSHRGASASIIGAIGDPRHPQPAIIESAKKMGLPTFILESHGRFDFTAIFRLRKYLKENHIDILHTHNYRSDAVGLFAARMAGIPIVATAHGYTDMTHSVSFYEKLDRFILRFFNRVVVVADSVLPNFPAAKKIVISNGLDVGKFAEARGQPPKASLARLARRESKRAKGGKSEVRKKFGIGENDIVIGTVGRLSIEKNQGMLIGSVAELAKKYSNLKLLIVGDGPEELNLRLKSEDFQITDKIIFTGLVYEMPPIYQAMDIFALTSITEGIPLTILEAMASRRPVIATKVGGIPQIIENNITGKLVSSNDVRSFTLELENLINDKSMCAKLTTAAFDFVRDNFSQKRMIEQYRKVYEKLAGLPVPQVTSTPGSQSPAEPEIMNR